MELLKLHSSDAWCFQQEGDFQLGKGGQAAEADKKAPPDITLKIGGQFIGLQRDIERIVNKELYHFSSVCPTFQHFLSFNKISVIFSKSPNLGNLVVNTILQQL